MVTWPQDLVVGLLFKYSDLPSTSAVFRIFKQQLDRPVLLIDTYAFAVDTGKANADDISVRVQNMVASRVVALRDGLVSGHLPELFRSRLKRYPILRLNRVATVNSDNGIGHGVPARIKILVVGLVIALAKGKIHFGTIDEPTVIFRTSSNQHHQYGDDNKPGKPELISNLLALEIDMATSFDY